MFIKIKTRHHKLYVVEKQLTALHLGLKGFFALPASYMAADLWSRSFDYRPMVVLLASLAIKWILDGWLHGVRYELMQIQERKAEKLAKFHKNTEP